MPVGADGYELCHPVDQADFETINLLLNGIARQTTWRPIQMRIVREDEGKSLARSDSPWLGSHALILRSRVLEVLGKFLLRYGEALPVACDGANLWMYNPTRVLAALDEAASSVIRFSDGRIMMIQRHVFLPDVVAGNEVFKISSLRVSPIFVNHRFVELWEESGLTGLEFKKVWATEFS